MSKSPAQMEMGNRFLTVTRQELMMISIQAHVFSSPMQSPAHFTVFSSILHGSIMAFAFTSRFGCFFCPILESNFKNPLR